MVTVENRIAFISDSLAHGATSARSMGASFDILNAVGKRFAFADGLCDELATALGIHATAVMHKEFGDVSRHNLILNEMARHSGAGVGSSKMKPRGFAFGLPVARQTA